MPTIVPNTDTYRDKTWTLIELGINNQDTASTPAIVWTPIDSDAVTLSPNVVTSTTQGTTKKYETQHVDKYSFTITNQVYAEIWAQLILPQVASPVNPDLFRAFYTGNFSGVPNMAVRMTETAKRISDGRQDTFIYTYPVCTVESYADIDGFAVAPAINHQSVVLNAQATTVDLLGVPIPSAPAGGFFYMREIQ